MKLCLVCWLVLCAGCCLGEKLGVATYRVGQWSEFLALGNHRAVVKVRGGGDAVRVMIPWRRRDLQPASKAVIVTDARNQRVPSHAVKVTGDYGKIMFQPVAGDERYFIYYLPYQRAGKFEAEQYLAPEDPSDNSFLKRLGLRTADEIMRFYGTLPEASVEAIESRGAFNSFYPMEVCATLAEVEAFKQKLSGDASFVVFPEPSTNPIKMSDRLPISWVEDGPRKTLELVARPGAYLTFQLGIYAPFKEKILSEVIFHDLKNESGEIIPMKGMTCFNLSGRDCLGNLFSRHVAVGCGKVQPLWIGCAVPGNARGVYQGTCTVQADQGSGTVALTVSVTGDPIPFHGDDGVTSMSRLRWLNSDKGLDDTILPGFEPLDYTAGTVSLAHRSVTYQSNGLPARIVSNGCEVLARPVTLTAVMGNKTVVLTGEGQRLSSWKKSLMSFESLGRLGGLRAHVGSTAEADGCFEFEVILQADRDQTLDNLYLQIPVRSGIARYVTGMGQQGGYRKGDFNWKWGKDNLDRALWLGIVKAGVQIKLLEEDERWTLWGNAVKPNAWHNGGQGGCQVREARDEVMVKAYCGRTRLQAGRPIRLRFRLMITPFKQLDNRHWAHRVSHFSDNLNVGWTVQSIFQGSHTIPYINYPFSHMQRIRQKTAHDRYNAKQSELIYDLKERMSPKAGTIHLSCMVNFDYWLKRKRDDRDNHRLFTLDFGADIGQFGLQWNADTGHVRGFFMTRVNGKRTFQVIGGRGGRKFQFGQRLDIVFSWGKRLALSVNGERVETAFQYENLLAKADKASLKIHGDRFIHQGIDVYGNEQAAGKPVFHDAFGGGETQAISVDRGLVFTAKLEFDPKAGVPRNPWHNRMLGAVDFGHGRKLIAYWNVDDGGMRLICQERKGERVERRFLMSGKVNWKQGETHCFGLQLENKLNLLADGRIIAEKELDSQLRALLAGPAALEIYDDGFDCRKITDGREQVIYSRPERSALNMTAGGGVFYGNGRMTYNGLSLPMERRRSKFQIYYTVRELSNHCQELWAFRSLGDEIYASDKGGVYLSDLAFICGRGGGYPWLREHLVDNYIPAWRSVNLGEDFCASLSTNSVSRLLNYYLEGLSHLLGTTPITGLYLDGIGFDRKMMKRVARTMYHQLGRDYTIEMHCADLYRKENGSVINLNLEHLPYLTNLWLGEGFNYNMPPDFYLVEMSGLPFGVRNDMLNYNTGGNPHRGMVFGMSARLYPDIRYLWDFWDRNKMDTRTMIGYWDEACPVRTDSHEQYSTCYSNGKNHVVATAHWSGVRNKQRNDRLVLPNVDDNADLTVKGARCTRFMEHGSDLMTPFNQQTTVYTAVQKDGLRVRFVCSVSDWQKDRQLRRDGNVWHDDSVEFYVRPKLSATTYYQFVGNVSGTVFDHRDGDRNWNGEWNYRTERHGDHWVGDLLVSWRTLGIAPLKAGDKLAVNVARNTNGKCSVWHPVTGPLNNVASLAPVTVGASATRQPELQREEMPDTFRLLLDYEKMHLNPKTTRVVAPAIPGFQRAAEFRPGDRIPIRPSKGYLFVISDH